MRITRRRIGVALLASVAAGGTAWAASAGRSGVESLQELAPGGWTIVAREGGSVLLTRKPDREVTEETKGKAAAVEETLVYAGGQATPGRPRAESLDLPAPGGTRAAVRAARLGERDVLFTPVGSGPQVRGAAGQFAVESGGSVWRVAPGRAPQRLTADEAGGLRRADLEARASEERGGLLWAADPRWSPDARWLAYASNREAVAAGGAGQSVWVVDAQSGQERALLHRAGASFSVLGWLGGELLVTGTEGGITAVDPGSGAERAVAQGTFVAADERGTALAWLEGADPASFRLRVQRAGGAAVSAGAPPAGFEWAAGGDFTVDGARLAVVASAADGRKQVGVVDVASGATQFVAIPGVPRGGALTDPPRWLDGNTLLVTIATRGREQSRRLQVPAAR